MGKQKWALYWAASCGGCEIAVLDVNEKILDIAAAADIVLWPCAMDFKYDDVRAMADRSIDVCLFNGAIRSSEQEEIARLLRAKSRVMVAFGSCACTGGIPGLANLTTKDEILDRVYIEAQSVVGNGHPVFPQPHTRVAEGDLELPVLYEEVSKLSQVIPVDYYLPGCPPTPDLIMTAVNAIATGQLPPPGAVIAGEKTLCDVCPRVKQEKKITRIYRPHQIIPEPQKCLLEQGLICCGPATREGCGAQCIQANMPCRGCFGPPAGVIDQGAKLVSAVASIYEGDTPESVAAMLEEIVDPAGTFYRYGMADSLLKRKRVGTAGK
ncbi:MAG: oxidoreductase [Bacteroidetes bacterium]|nr:oxidoreductase [Bacteroidota bacterium]MCL5025900.1 oxidoreductase [Chloroflexota bacterium]